MNGILNAALSGLIAQTKRLEISASNVVNVRSQGVRPDSATPQPEAYVPHQAALTSTAGGGVRATAVPVSPPSVLSYEPGAPDADADGLVARPNVSLERELVTQISSLRSFQANIKVIEIEDERLGTLLNLVT